MDPNKTTKSTEIKQKKPRSSKNDASEESELKKIRIPVQVTKKEKQLIQAIAKSKGYSNVSEYIRIVAIYKPYNEIDYEGNYNCCPDCGVALTDKNDGGNGFCSECGWKH